MLSDTINSFELYHPALSIIKVTCFHSCISFDKPCRNIFIAFVLAYGSIAAYDCPVL